VGFEGFAGGGGQLALARQQRLQGVEARLGLLTFLDEALSMPGECLGILASEQDVLPFLDLRLETDLRATCRVHRLHHTSAVSLELVERLGEGVDAADSREAGQQARQGHHEKSANEFGA
jgi:hypothetical protein